MKNPESKLSRRDLFKFGGAATLVGSTLLGAKGAFASGSTIGQACGGGQVIEAFPASPLILSPFTDPLTILEPLQPSTDWGTWYTKPMTTGCQDSRGNDHQVLPSTLGLPKPIIYNMKLQVREHNFTSSKVMAMKNVIQNGNLVRAAGSTQSLPASTIYGFNGTFPGPMIYAQYGKPSLVRIENNLDQNPYNLDRCDFGAPDWGFLTHLHNGHTEPMSDGNPNYCPNAYQPGMYVDNLYLNYPAGNDETEKQSFFWFHDHRMDHTGADVYKGMVGIYPIYDPLMDNGDETKGFRLPGVPSFNSDGSVDYTKRIEYDIPLVFSDARLDDGVTPHKDFHNGCGETHPEWWGKTFFRHFPDHGFVGDIFAINGTAYPTYDVKRRHYRFRLLGASISRIYDFKLMSGGAPVASPGTDGQYLLPRGQQCMKFTEIAVDGGLLPKPVIKDSQQIWPAKRREVVVDFSKYMDGSPTKKGDVVYLVNVSKMGTGRMPESPDPNYKVPMLRFVIGDDAVDNSLMPAKFRDLPYLPMADIKSGNMPQRTFEFQRGSAGGEIQWMVNGKPFDATVSMAFPEQGSGELWTIRNGGGGWVHPVHFHMEEHQIQSRTGGMAADDYSKEDVVALGPSESITFYRRFRTFTGKYVAHCHNLAHEDHAMMFGWEIVPKGTTVPTAPSTKGGSGTSGSGSSGSGSGGK
jgi:FtsP/CotA-like multicopper oxidase with cupredoxin domain